MRQVDYKDEKGRYHRVKLPDDAPDDQAPLGVLVGPPDVVDYLNLPEPFATTLHNQLYHRGLFTAKDIRKRSVELQGAILAALAVDTGRLHEAYVHLENEAIS